MLWTGCVWDWTCSKACAWPQSQGHPRAWMGDHWEPHWRVSGSLWHTPAAPISRSTALWSTLVSSWEPLEASSSHNEPAPHCTSLRMASRSIQKLLPVWECNIQLISWAIPKPTEASQMGWWPRRSLQRLPGKDKSATQKCGCPFIHGFLVARVGVEMYPLHIYWWIPVH